MEDSNKTETDPFDDLDDILGDAAPMGITSGNSVQSYEQDEEMDEQDQISRFLKPDSNCLLCSADNFSYAVNRDWLDGKVYREIVKKHGAEYGRISGGKKLCHSLLAVHFAQHMNVAGAAVSKWSKRLLKRTPSRAMVPTPDQENLFSLLVDRHIDNHELAKLAIREILSSLKMMKDEIDAKQESGRVMDLVSTIEKYNKLLQGFASTIQRERDLESKLEIDASHIQSAKILDFVVLRNAGLIDSEDPKYSDFIRSAETLWINVAMAEIAERVGNAIKKVDLDAAKRMTILKQVNASVKGLENAVQSKYEKEMQFLRERQLGAGDVIDVEVGEDDDEKKKNTG